MSERIAADARKAFNASKAIPKGEHPPPQTWKTQSLGGPVVGSRPSPLQGSRQMLQHAEERGRSANGPNPRTDQCRCRSSREAGVYIRGLRRAGLLAALPAEVEGVHADDH